MRSNANGFWVSELRPSSVNTIVSTVPSQTELLFYLGLGEQVIGLTHFCIHPKEWYTTKVRIGGTKNINIKKIKELQPSFVLANKEENVRGQIEELAQIVPVYVTDVFSLETALLMINEVGKIVQQEAKATKLIETIQHSFEELRMTVHRKYNTCYLIWKEPYMTIGGDTFISNLLGIGGFKNVFEQELRYPEVGVEQLKQMNIDVLFLSSEPYPFKEKHIVELQKELPYMNIQLVDGEMFSWYGSRLLHSAKYIENLYKQISNE